MIPLVQSLTSRLRLLHVQCVFFLEMEEEEETFCFADSTRFITDPDFCYQEFARREEDHFQVFRVQVGLIYLLM